MAITNYAELVTALTNWQGHDTTESARYPEAIALFESWFNRRARVRQMEATALLPLTASEVAVPADYLAWRSVEWLGIDPARELKWVHPKRIQTGWTPISDTVEFFTIENGVISIIPVDAADNDIVLRYYQKLAPLTSVDDVNWVIIEHPDLYLFGSLTEMMGLRRDFEGMMAWKTRRDETLAEIAALSVLTQGEDAVRDGEYF